MSDQFDDSRRDHLARCGDEERCSLRPPGVEAPADRRISHAATVADGGVAA
ncbi:hypothetical protein SAMN05421805_10786 [Saccharopolyspora antimicrobica]|uniref:Uncharacterized protein n=1 Tax=Saccharopolyspora antimicrobica TaxID=455193 RepID=A0A1I5C7F2_9PSEU|nr:hypothetical protein [Saccharopolyspora antimicrobica]RKT88949.1 hypothetical protein ATL45_7395 [Saccharopolyspora antimicrobica]SFN82796.1 hypothetical protein SAMN05421805_10786 [Saccharopolyspora antimicrobica]